MYFQRISVLTLTAPRRSGHAQLATTELYAHHVPKRNAAGALTEFVNAQKQGMVTVTSSIVVRNRGACSGSRRR